MSTVLLNRTQHWPPVPRMHHWMRVPGSQDTKRHKHVDVSNMNILSLHSSTASEERETDLLVLSSYSSYSCCDCWAEKRPLRPFAAVPQRSRCHPGHSWGFAGEDKSWGLAWRIWHYETVKGAVSYILAKDTKKKKKTLTTSFSMRWASFSCDSASFCPEARLSASRHKYTHVMKPR